jgi:hypothetical protein
LTLSQEWIDLERDGLDRLIVIEASYERLAFRRKSNLSQTATRRRCECPSSIAPDPPVIAGRFKQDVGKDSCKKPTQG